MQTRPEVGHHFFMGGGLHATLREGLETGVDLGCPRGVPRRLLQEITIVGLEAVMQCHEELLAIFIAERERVLQELFDRHDQA